MGEETEGVGNGPQPLPGVRVLVLFGGVELFGQELATIEVFRNMMTLAVKAKFVISGKWGHEKIRPELERHGFECTTAPFGYLWTKQMLGRHFGYFLANIYGIVATSLKVSWEIRQWKPTHIFAGNWVYLSYAFPAVWFLRLPLVYRAGDELPMHTRFHRWFTRKLVARFDGVVCISKFIQERFSAVGMSRARMRVVYNYPPERAKTSVPTPPSVPEGAVVVTYVGQVSIRKGVLVLLDAVERMIKERRNLVLWVIGEPSWDDRLLVDLKQRIAASGVEERVVFFGYVSNPFPLLTQSDIHVCPTLSAEPLSNVVGEAKLCGKPSVVFPSGGLPELIEHKVDGYICRDCTVESLTEGIDYFANDSVTRVSAGQAARRSLEEKFGEERFRRDWAEVFIATAPRSV